MKIARNHTMETKTCGCCKKELPLDKFFNNKKLLLGKSFYCKKCTMEKRKNDRVRKCIKCGEVRPVEMFREEEARRTCIICRPKSYAEQTRKCTVCKEEVLISNIHVKVLPCGGRRTSNKCKPCVEDPEKMQEYYSNAQNRSYHKTRAMTMDEAYQQELIHRSKTVKSRTRPHSVMTAFSTTV